LSCNFNPLNTQRGGTHPDDYTILPINVPVGLRSFVFSHQGNAIDDSLVVKSLEHGDPPFPPLMQGEWREGSLRGVAD
jgi:hypothetical protein